MMCQPPRTTHSDTIFPLTTHVRSMFAQFTWAPEACEDRLRVTAGVRQSWDKRWALKNFLQTQYVEAQLLGTGLTAVPVPAFVLGGTDEFDNVEASRKDSAFTPSANLQYDFTKQAPGSLSYTTASKRGGFNTRDPPVSPPRGKASDP